MSNQSGGAVNHALNLIDGEWISAASERELREPFRGDVVTTTHTAEASDVDTAIAAASRAAGGLAAMKGYERAAILRRASELLARDAEVIAFSLVRETGKAIRDARTEVQRAVEVMAFCSEEAIRIEGRQIPLDGSAAGAGKIALSMRFPVGVVAAIVPFNAPVNLTCHKVGPAFAAGNPMVLKAPPQAAHTLHLLFERFVEAGFPEGTLNLLHGDADIGQAMIADERVSFISFTGSGKAGVAIKKAVGLRGCILELGGIGPTIIHKDANLTAAADICAATGYRLAGQSCASVQNLFVHVDVIDEFSQMMKERVERLKVGDPMDPDVDLGPVIDEAAAKRIESSIADAVINGATLICGGQREGTVVYPTLLTDVRPEMKVACEEIFGPVIVLRAYKEIATVYEWINGTGLGLNCGLFTESHSVAFNTLRAVPCAAIIINGSSTYRPDQMPYGGLRNSGYGRESPADSIRAMTQERIVVFN
jgi:acyl-CoA reductase-like NAD-dependent aldehyde dehydrogenase